MPPYGREHRNRGRLGAAPGHGRQIADHTAGYVGQSKLDCPVQVLQDITKLADTLNDHYLTRKA